MNHASLKSFAVFGALILSVIGLSARAAVPAIILDDTTRWSTGPGELSVELYGHFLPDYGLEILLGGEAATRRVRDSFVLTGNTSLNLYVPYGHFQGFIDGSLDVRTDIVLRHRGNEVSLEHLSLVPTVYTNNHPALEARDELGRSLLVFSHLHIETDHDNGLLTIHNADINATSTLAGLLGLPVLTQTPIGMAWLDLDLRIPAGAAVTGDGGPLDGTTGLSCDGRPFWPQEQNEIDVALIGIGTVAYQGRDPSAPSHIKVAPSATLKNISEGDVPWIPKFSSLGSYPYNPPDQHPFLVWNMYRISDGRIEQLAASGVKHAFFTLNFNCSLSCGYINGRILAPGCEDTYSTGNNDSNSNQGPRYDIMPSLGLFDSCNSFFSPGPGCTQTNNSTSFENRLVVDESELSTPGAEYFFDSWYVIQFDTDIWNSMGHHEINPSPSGSGWSFNPGPFMQGPAISQWVSESSVDPMAGHVLVKFPSQTPNDPYPGNMPQGYLRVLVKVTEVGENRWRYNYAVQNYDMDRNVNRFEIPLAADAEVFETYFGDVKIDGMTEDPWTTSRVGDTLSFQAPSGAALKWFSLYNFEVETDAAPNDRGEVRLGISEPGVPSETSVGILVPGDSGWRFRSGFEVGAPR